jgi:hypothetical protein
MAITRASRAARRCGSAARARRRNAH